MKRINLMNPADEIYQLDGKVSIGKAIPIGLQHVMAMFVSNVTPIIILACAAGVDSALTASLVQNAMVIAGIGTLIQIYPVWRIGSRLPIVMGISITFLSISIVIATTLGMGALIGAVIIGGVFEGVLGLFAKYWIKKITPIIAATVVTGIGFSLLPIGACSFAGGQGATDFGSAQNWIVGSVTLLTCLGVTAFAKGFLKSLAVLFGLIVGYTLAACMGMVHLSFEGVDVVALPKILPFKPVFNPGAVLSVVCVYLVSATETIGDITAMTNSTLGRNVRPEELSGAVAGDGFISSLSGVFGCTPITSFSQNVGLLAMTHVINRFAIAVGAAILLLAGLFPAVGVLLTSIPQAVLGGCTIMMFGSIMFTGISIIAKNGFGNRNMIIVSLSLSIGLGFTQSPAMFDVFPDIVKTVFAENCVAVIFIVALLLDNILPKESR